jgi:hypothetical protein
MPLEYVQIGKYSYVRWGKTGHLYRYNPNSDKSLKDAESLAKVQSRAIHASEAASSKKK